MDTIVADCCLGKLPTAEFQKALRDFLAPMLPFLPEKRLRAIPELAVQGILAGQSPQITRMAAAMVRPQVTSWPMAKRLYRFIWNDRFSSRDLLKGLYALTHRAVAQAKPRYLLVALDPVNFEKPYTEELEGVSTVMKSTPPSLDGEKRLTPGYPAITATVVNLKVPFVSYANWFSYRTQDFVSEYHELYRALRITRALFPDYPLCFLGDAGLDNQRLFAACDLIRGKFIIRACHNRRLLIYDDATRCWIDGLLQDYANTLPTRLKARVAFRHAHRVRHVEIGLTWFRLRLPETGQTLTALVAYDPDYDRQLILLTNIRIDTQQMALAVYTAWRFRPRIEHTYRFDQEDGLDVEDLRVRTLERMRRVFVLVLVAALFVYHLDHSWSPRLILWLRLLGGKLGRRSDCDGFYLLLAGISMLLHTVATLQFAQRIPLPAGFTCG